MRQIIDELTENDLTEEEVDCLYELLLNHFGYSIKDIKSYNELTSEEKKIIPEELFEKITRA